MFFLFIPLFFNLLLGPHPSAKEGFDKERLRHQLRVTFNGLEDTSPLSGGSGTVVDELILPVLPVGGHP